MKQKHSKWNPILITLVCLIILCGTLVVTAVNTSQPIKAVITSQEPALNANQTLMQYFFDNGYITEYPDYFSGCYIDEDNYYHICLNSPTEQEMKTLESILGGYKNVVLYEYCEYSQNELQEYADTVAKELIDNGHGVTKWYVDVTANNVVIGVLNTDLEAVKAWITDRRTLSLGSALPRIIITEGTYISTDATPINGGDLIIIGNSGLSAGICGIITDSLLLLPADTL